MRSLTFLLAASLAIAQTQFEVASIKPNTGVERAVQFGFPSPGTFRARNVWLRFLIQNAWDVKDYQILAAPAWAATARYDIDAKTSGDTPRQQMKLMIQSLLQDRFQLKLHHESKTLPIYRLVPASKGELKLHAGTCGEPRPACGDTSWSPRSLDGTSITMEEFIAMLSNILQRPVIDQTSFSGKFDAHLSWIPDPVTPGLLAPGVTPAPLPPANQDGPTIFSALTDQLGLKLQAATGSVDVLVIESAEKPSAN